MHVGDEAPPFDFDDPPSHSTGWTIERKEKENAKRAKQSIYELARANSDKWEWFVTLTLDPRIVRRDDYKAVMQHIRKWCRSLTYRGCYWLFVPERHRDGKAYHFHGLVGGSFPMTYAGKHGYNGRQVDTWNVLGFPGFTSVQRVVNPSRVSTYITKYITKDLIHMVPKGCHRYLHSQNLSVPQVEYLSLTPLEFLSLLHDGLYPDTADLDRGLSDMRFVKKVPMYYQLPSNFMYLVED